MLATVGAVILTSLAVSMATYNKGLALINASSITLFKASEVGLPRSKFAADAIVTVLDQRKLKAPLVSQYHMDLQSEAMPEAIFILGLSGPARLYLNGIGLKASSPQPISGPTQGAFWLMSEIPPALLNPGENRIDIVMQPALWRTGLTGVRLGTTQAVTAQAAAHQSLMAKFSGLSLIVGLICLICIPITFFIERARANSLGACVIAAMLIAAHFASEGQTSSPLILLPLVWGDVVMLIASGALLIGSQSLTGWAGSAFKGLALALLVSAVVSLFGWRLQIDAPWQISFSLIAPLALAGIGMPVLVATSLKSLIDERALARHEAAQQAALLAEQAKVIEKQAEFQAVIEERKRFTRDIHDGIGGQLVSLLWRVRSETVPAEELANEIESGIADLRLVADALDEGTVSLPVALWNFSARARQQLDAANIGFEWSLPEDVDVDWSDARRILSLYRMLQECVSNIVRHAKATQVRILFRLIDVSDRQFLEVIVEDNGVGFDPDSRRGGRGLTNLKTRANQMGGTIAFSRSDNHAGTRIEIVLPAAQSADATA